MKASEKQELTKKLVTRLEKQFGRSVEPPERTVLDTLLYAVCLENVNFASAERAYEALQTEFHDLNEIRVSSISELVGAFTDQPDAEIRAHRVRTILQFVFEDQFEFDLEALRKKTQDQAAKKLGQIRDLSPFVRNYVQQAALGAHVIPLDDRQTAVVTWLGLVEPGTTTEAAAEQLKPAVRKADGSTLCHVLRVFATDSPAASQFDPETFAVPEEGYSAADALPRVEEALSGKSHAVSKPKAVKTAAKKASQPAKTKAAKASKPVKAKKAAKSAASKTDGTKKKAAKKSAGTKHSPSTKATKGRSRATS